MNFESISELSKLRSQSGGTSLITYYIQGSSNFWLAVDKLNSELSTASNIKSKAVRKDVIQSLKGALYQLKKCKESKAPENGIVLCSGTTLCPKASKNNSYV